MNTQNKTRIKPAGWLAIVVLAALAIGVLGTLIRPLTAQPLPASEVIGTIEPRTPTPDRRAPTPLGGAQAATTPLPEGWTLKTEQLSGKTYFAPPAEVEQQIIEAFNAVLACYYAEDADDTTLLQQPDKNALCASAQQRSTSGFATTIEPSTFREINILGPINPVRCTDMTTCTVARAKLQVKGAILFDAASCQKLNQTAPCAYRNSEIKGLTPYQLHIATVTLQEDKTWKVADWAIEQLPEPPPSP
ncbi:MAG TPA: hypothetical protein VJ793_23525 [Anaerolineae bacterium]|nr:hypothetical protein [Anaerolineae bacterium]